MRIKVIIVKVLYKGFMQRVNKSMKSSEPCGIPVTDKEIQTVLRDCTSTFLVPGYLAYLWN